MKNSNDDLDFSAELSPEKDKITFAVTSKNAAPEALELEKSLNSLFSLLLRNGPAPDLPVPLKKEKVKK